MNKLRNRKVHFLSKSLNSIRLSDMNANKVEDALGLLVLAPWNLLAGRPGAKRQHESGRHNLFAVAPMQICF